MIAYVAQQTEKGFTAKIMIHIERFAPRFNPTDCRTFSTFDEANKAARFMADETGKQFVNMR